MRNELITRLNPKSPVSEIYRTLRTNIQFMNKKMKTLLITSSTPGEGKSTIAANLAITFAQAGKKVIIVDADMRKGRQYSIFEIAMKPGLSNYLASDNESIDKFIQTTDEENLYVMASGSIPPNPSELLISPQMQGLIHNLSETFDIVIIDGTPCELVTDSVIISRVVDSTVIVVESNKTTKACLDKTIKGIQNVGGKIAGIVLNKAAINKRKYENSYYSHNSLTTTKNRYQGRFCSDEKSNINASADNLKSKDESNEANKTDNSTENILKQVNDYLNRSTK